MLTHSFVYSDPTRETVTISVDDFTLIDEFLYDVLKELKSCAWHDKVEECRNYCNLYLDIQHEYEIVKETRLARVEKEALEKRAKEESEATEETPEVTENDSCGRVEF